MDAIQIANARKCRKRRWRRFVNRTRVCFSIAVCQVEWINLFFWRFVGWNWSCFSCIFTWPKLMGSLLTRMFFVHRATHAYGRVLNDHAMWETFAITAVHYANKQNIYGLPKRRCVLNFRCSITRRVPHLCVRVVCRNTLSFQFNFHFFRWTNPNAERKRGRERKHVIICSNLNRITNNRRKWMKWEKVRRASEQESILKPSTRASESVWQSIGRVPYTRTIITFYIYRLGTAIWCVCSPLMTGV